MSPSKKIIMNSFLKLTRSAGIASLGFLTLFLGASALTTTSQAATTASNNSSTEPKHRAPSPVTVAPAPPVAKDSQTNIVVDKPAFVFVRATPAAFSKAMEAFQKQYSAEDMGEAGSDIAYYEMRVSDFAKKKKIAVISTDQPEVVFKKRNGSDFRLKNTINQVSSDIYMFDGMKNPQKINDIATFEDGKEYHQYFVNPARKR